MTMAGVIQIALYSFAPGVTVILGGFLARLKVVPRSELGREISHGIVAFGGRVLGAAIAFVLAPRGAQLLSLPALTLVFFLGAVFVCELQLTLTLNKEGDRVSLFMPKDALASLFRIDEFLSGTIQVIANRAAAP